MEQNGDTFFFFFKYLTWFCGRVEASIISIYSMLSPLIHVFGILFFNYMTAELSPFFLFFLLADKWGEKPDSARYRVTIVEKLLYQSSVLLGLRDSKGRAACASSQSVTSTKRTWDGNMSHYCNLLYLHVTIEPWCATALCFRQSSSAGSNTDPRQR